MVDRVGDVSDLQREKAEYIERMASELGRIASTVGLPMLSYLLEMAAEEAALIQAGGAVRTVPIAPVGRRQPRSAAR